MANTDNALLNVETRTETGSRISRRLRKTGLVPGIFYGLQQDPIQVQLNARDLRHAIASSGAVIELTVDGGASVPAMLKEVQRHPVRGDYIHVDLIRVNLDERVSAVVPIELTDTEESVGVKLGGVLERFLREVHVDALPNAIPEIIEHSVKDLEVGQSVTLADVTAPEGVVIQDDAKTLVATVSAPRVARAAGEDEDTAEENSETSAEEA